MKRIMFMAMLVISVAVLFTGSFALAQEVEIPVIFDRSYLELGGMLDPAANDIRNLDFHKQEIAVSPDGQLIAFVALDVFDIWVVPVEGGEPSRVYTIPDDQLLIVDEGDFAYMPKKYGTLNSLSFTPDGSEITFCRRYYDPEKGSSWEVIPKPAKTESSINFNGVTIPTIESVNITTGEVRTLVEEGSTPGWSSDGRYLSYIHFDHRINTDPEHAEHHRAAAILDAMTSETQFFNETCSGIVMTADNSTLVCTAGGSFFSLDVETGEKTEYPVELSGGFSLKRVPGSNYILYDELIDLEGILRLNSIFDPDTGTSVWAYLGMGAQSYSGSLTPDGNTIIYLKEFPFIYIREDGGSVNMHSATMICSQPFDAEMRFAVGNTVEPPVISPDYGLLPEYGTMISNVTTSNYVNPDIAWSPDGEKIAYSADRYSVFDETEKVFIRYGDQIWIAPSTGGDPQMVYMTPSFEYQGVTVTPGFLYICGYTPDGSEILFTRSTLDEARNSVPEVHITETRSGYRWSNPLPWLYAVNLENGNVRTVVEGACFGLYSPDGRYLAYTINNLEPTNDPFLEEHNNQIVVRNLETGEETFLNIYWGIDAFNWTNDSSSVMAYTSLSNSTFPSEYSLMPIDGSEPQKLLGYSTSYHINTVSPVNDQLVAYDYNRAIYLRNLAGGDQQRFSPEVAGKFSYPVFSPDGTKIACIIEYSGSDIGNPYQTSKKSKVFVLDLTVPSDVSPTAVADAAPTATLLIANYPNPFNPTTTISFSLPSAGIARLDIYSLSGQKVRELVNTNLTAGMHDIVWDSRNDNGMPLATGVYIARIATGNHVATQRMLLMK